MTGRGILASEEYLSVLRDHLTADKEKFKRYRYSLSDYTAVTKVEVSADDVRLIAKLSVYASNLNPELVVAIVADRDVSYGLSRLWQLSTDESEWEILVFRSRDDAEAWLRERCRERFGIDDLTLD